MSNIVIYGFTGCEPCEDAERWMNQQGIEYEKKDIIDGFDAYPIIDIGDRRVVGFSDTVKQLIIEEVKSNG